MPINNLAQTNPLAIRLASVVEITNAHRRLVPTVFHPIDHDSRPRHAVIVDAHSFNVRHRNRTYGPFAIQWALDLTAHELIYRRELIAAIGTHPAVYADLSATELPPRVRQIAVVVFAAFCESIRRGLNPPQQRKTVQNTLAEHGFQRFQVMASP